MKQDSIKKLQKQKESLKDTLKELKHFNTVMGSILKNKDNLIPEGNDGNGLEELWKLNNEAIKLNKKELEKINKRLEQYKEI